MRLRRSTGTFFIVFFALIAALGGGIELPQEDDRPSVPPGNALGYLQTKADKVAKGQIFGAQIEDFFIDFLPIIVVRILREKRIPIC